jgi:hypothetical protein
MPIITNSTFGQLVNSSAGKISREKYVDDLTFFLQNVIKNKLLYYIFNFYERKKLFTAKYLLENEKEFINEFYRALEARSDNKTYVYSKGGKYKYHLYENCKSVSSEYIDFIIPDDIRLLGDEAVNYFRKWFDDRGYKNMYLQARNRDAINAKIQVAYNSVFPKLFKLNKVNVEYNFIRERTNSGNTKIAPNFDLVLNKNELNNLIEERKKLIGDNLIRMKMANYDFLLNKDDTFISEYLLRKFEHDICSLYGLRNIKKFWQKHLAIKQKVYDNLIEFFKWTYNFKEKNYDEIDLEKLGFECCKVCLKTQSSPEFQAML